MSTTRQHPSHQIPILPDVKRRLLLAASAAGILALAAATYITFTAVTSGNQFTATGTVRLTFGQFEQSTTPRSKDCWGAGGFDDLRPGAQVTVEDPSGKVLAAGTITTGEADALAGSRQCALRFEVADIPAGETLYGLVVGRRDPVQMREETLRAPINLTI